MFACGFELFTGFLIATVFFPDITKSATLKPLVMGTRGAVGAGNPLVAEAGLRILQKGGNAVDAGVATVFAAAVVEQTSVGMGGECPILLKLPGKPVVAINGVGIAPELATVDFYRKLDGHDPRLLNLPTFEGDHPGIIPSFGPLSAIVPGAIDSLLVALENFGTKSFAEVIQPAIELAQGFPLDAQLAGDIAKYQPTLQSWPSSRKVFLPNGRPPKMAELFSQPDLAGTLEYMVQAEQKAARNGRAAAIEAVRDYVYGGPTAKRIGEFCKQTGCLLRESDFAAYRAKVEQPLTTNYRGVDVYKVSFWSQGPVFLQHLNMLEKFDLKSMGHNSAEYIHTLVEAMKLGFADRDAYYGDPDFSSIPPQLLTKEYANLRRPLIDNNHASAEHMPGDPEHMAARAPADFARARFSQRNAEHQDTTCVNVIDKDGGMFSATPSGGWLPSFIAGDTGIPLNQRMQSFGLTPGHPNQLAPHRRPRITLTPPIALKNGQPWLAVSTPGGDSQEQTLLQIFLNVLEFGMNPQQAVEAPRFNSEAMYGSFDDHRDQPLVLSLEERIAPEVMDQLRARAHQIVVKGPWGNSTAPTLLEYNPAGHVIRAGADLRGLRYALAW